MSKNYLNSLLEIVKEIGSNNYKKNLSSFFLKFFKND